MICNLLINKDLLCIHCSMNNDVEANVGLYLQKKFFFGISAVVAHCDGAVVRTR